jgi:hydroxybutyrate-dimer hydrolase
VLNEFLTSAVRETAHRGSDDLLFAGLGLAGMRAAPAPFADPQRPTPAELRRRAIQAAWQGIADLCAFGGYGETYGEARAVPGREYHAFAKLPHARWPHRVLAQVPDHFDERARCLVVTASSGSRGIYGAIALAGAWGLPRGCAVAYTDKGAGSGYFDTASATGVALDGTRAHAGDTPLEFAPDAPRDAGIGVKHAHSRDNAEADWGRHVLQAAQFGLAMLDRALPHAAPFTSRNTRIIAVGLSNGGGAVLQAAGLDDDRLLSGVVALAPNVFVPGSGRALYDYATEAALLLPCALLDARFDATPFARIEGRIPPAWHARCATLHAAGLISASAPTDAAREALGLLQARGWTDAALAAAASTNAFDAWRAIAATYASAYLRRPVGSMPSGFRFVARDAAGHPVAPSAAERAAWWCDASGIPPGAGVFLDEPDVARDPDDPDARALLELRALWTGGDASALALRESIAATIVRQPRNDLPLWIIHGREDGLLPSAFHGEPYVAWLRANGRDPIWWPIAHAQHFDAFLSLPAFGDRYVPLLPYGYRALDRMHDHLVHGSPPTPCPPPTPKPRGGDRLTRAHLGF